MDIKDNLPDKYFSNSVSELEEKVDGSDLDYVVDNIVDYGDEYKMIGEETSGPSSVTASKPKVSTSIPERDQNLQPTTNNPNISEESISNNNSNILDELKKIDEKINALELSATSLVAENTPINNNFKNEDSTINVVNKNLFDDESFSQNKNSIYEGSTVNNSIKNNEYPSNSIATNNNETKNIEIIKKEINQLKEVREQMLNSLYYNEGSNNNLTKNIISDNNAKVSVDNFTPDIFNNDKTEAITNSIKTENVFGNDPKVTIDDFGEPAVISGDQIDLKSAIQEHGGIEKGINDSVEQQNFVSNFANDKNINNIFNKDENIFNDSFMDSLENNYSELRADNNLDVVKNTKNTVAAIEGLSKQFNALAKAITAGFNSMNGNIREIKYNQNNNFMGSNNSQFSTSSVTTMRPDGSSRENAYLPTEIRGNTPLSDHFPTGFDLNKLGSNLTNRI